MIGLGVQPDIESSEERLKRQNGEAEQAWQARRGNPRIDGKMLPHGALPDDTQFGNQQARDGGRRVVPFVEARLGQREALAVVVVEMVQMLQAQRDFDEGPAARSQQAGDFVHGLRITVAGNMLNYAQRVNEFKRSIRQLHLAAAARYVSSIRPDETDSPAGLDKPPPAQRQVAIRVRPSSTSAIRSRVPWVVSAGSAPAS